MHTVYLDHAATTPPDPRVLETMSRVMSETWGNPSSVHSEGRKARHLIESCRERVAHCLGASPSEIIFTSGATESNNLALHQARGLKRLTTATTEHESVVQPASALEKSGLPVTWVVPGEPRGLGPDDFDPGITGLVSIMGVNNETGHINKVTEIAAHLPGAVVHADLVQAATFTTFDLERSGLHMASFSAHKINGPRGAGVLYVRSGREMAGMMLGGSQERGRRAGTENLAAIAGMTRAFELVKEECKERCDSMWRARIHLNEGIRSLGCPCMWNSERDASLAAPHILNISFPASENGNPVDGEMLILNMDLEGIRVSAGSACTSGALTPSHVLLAMGRDRSAASAAIRFSVGKDTSLPDIDHAVEALGRVCRRMGLLK